MRYLLILFFTISLFGDSYNFDEYRFINATSKTKHKSGNIFFKGEQTVITYTQPLHKKIIKDADLVTIEDSVKNRYKLKGKALFYTKMFINIMQKLGDIHNLKTDREYRVDKNGSKYSVTFIGDMKEEIPRAEALVKDSKVVEFKLFMKNSDTLEIVKK